MTLKLKVRIEETTIPQQVDLVRVTDIDNEKLLRHIREQGVEWFRRKEGTAGSEGSAGGDGMGWGMGCELLFGDAAELIRNTVQPRDVDDVPYIGLEHIEEGNLRLNGYGSSKNVGSAKFLFREGDVLFGKLRPYFRKVIRAPFDGVCSTDIWVVRTKTGVEQGYLYYWMAAEDFVEFATSGSEGTRMPRAKWEHVSRFSRPMLDISEQRAIAQILGTLDDKIELNRQMNHTLEAMAQALFKSWFVDFDPVVVNALRAGNPVPEKFAQRAAHYRDNPDALRLPEDTLRQFPDRFQESELGAIPEGWDAQKLGNVIDIHDSKRIPLNSRQRAEKKGSYRYYGASGIMDYVDDYIFDGTYILVGEDGTVIDNQDHPVVQYVWGKFWVNNHAHVLSGKNRITNEHLYLMMKNTNARPFVTGAVQPKISQTNLKRIPIILPKEEVLDLFFKFIDDLFEKYRENSKEHSLLENLRDTLLPKLISGELRVPDAEKLLEKAL